LLPICIDLEYRDFFDPLPRSIKSKPSPASKSVLSTQTPSKSENLASASTELTSSSSSTNRKVRFFDKVKVKIIAARGASRKVNKLLRMGKLENEDELDEDGEPILEGFGDDEDEEQESGEEGEGSEEEEEREEGEREEIIARMKNDLFEDEDEEKEEAGKLVFLPIHSQN
jgi:hypothetical protein